jgi:bifunctional UDP-N-acetylglucosamine pyrophosphorylase / glucosamine-1-phosphate N-acetyltransferase
MTTGSPPGITLANWGQWASPALEPDLWTAVVPAAGRGSRLGFDRPKILFPVAGRPVLAWLLDALLPVARSVVFVLSPAGRPVVEPELERWLPGRYQVVVQQEPTGMGDAVELARGAVSTPYLVVVWGDQVALRPESVAACARIHAGPFVPEITVPTRWRSAPYIHFVRDPAGRITSVLQAREGDPMPAEGEGDAGLFCFTTDALGRLLDRLRASPARSGRRTGEFNLLPVIPLAERVLTPRLLSLEETIGINTPAEAARLEEILRGRHAGR